MKSLLEFILDGSRRRKRRLYFACASKALWIIKDKKAKREPLQKLSFCDIVFW